MNKFNFVLLLILAVFGLTGCPEPQRQTSDQAQREQQEKMLAEATQQTGMPGIVNFRERKLAKLILELRDQEGLVTYTYLENMQPAVVPGKTALGGKLIYLGESIGYPLPYATQYTNPQKVEKENVNYGYAILPQADPNGLFSPASAEGTWVLLKNPKDKEVSPVYVEPRLVTSTFKFPVD